MFIHIGNVATDFYHLYPSDLKMAKRLGAEHFRMSISWARIFPDGDGAINQAGIDHYNKVIDYSWDIGIEPVVTGYHWDLPQVPYAI